MNVKNVSIIVIVLVFIGFLGSVVMRALTIPPSEGHNTETVIAEENIAIAYVAGGCFWCVESDLEKQGGVSEAVSGFMGGNETDPAYKDVASGKTGHREAVKVLYDPTQITFEKIVYVTLTHTDPTDAGGTFFDRGHQYTTAVYYQNEEERMIAEKVIAELTDREVFVKPIVTAIEKAGAFYPAEEGHQDYYQKNPLRYSYYRTGSGRDAFIKTLNLENMETHTYNNGDDWRTFNMPGEEELKAILTDIQYRVTQEDGTERPFKNEYNDNKEEGIYVDIVSGEPLFSSKDKYDSGTGWPSFVKPLMPENIVEREDKKLFTTRTEVRSKIADSHLGHVFNDGPKDSTGLRYCMNSAALRFIPKADLEKEGYGEFVSHFE